MMGKEQPSHRRKPVSSALMLLDSGVRRNDEIGHRFAVILYETAAALRTLALRRWAVGLATTTLRGILATGARGWRGAAGRTSARYSWKLSRRHWARTWGSGTCS